MTEIENTATEGLSEDAKTIIVVLLLIFAYPIGAVMMFFWVKWPRWVKIFLGLPILLIPLAIAGILAAVILTAINPQAQIEKARQVREMNQPQQQETPVENRERMLIEE